MYDIPLPEQSDNSGALAAKFVDPDFTAAGEPRALVALRRLDTLWINTGTLCNIECVNCYIESSPGNDRLSYFTAAEAAAYFDEIALLGLDTGEIGFTGGEPFMCPDIIEMVEDALGRGLQVLILTNAMKPMQRPRIKNELMRLNRAFANQLTLRVSLDHHTSEHHERERGSGSWNSVIAGLEWLCANGFNVDIAGRTCWGEAENDARIGYRRLFDEHKLAINADDPAVLVLFPEMDQGKDVAEISTSCWSTLGVKPESLMCASSRMIVKRKGAERPVVLPCTLLPYDTDFEMGTTLSDAATVDGKMFRAGKVKLNHPYCAQFCVLGGGSCSVG